LRGGGYKFEKKLVWKGCGGDNEVRLRLLHISGGEGVIIPLVSPLYTCIIFSLFDCLKIFYYV
jgi:hypothetical protein